MKIVNFPIIDSTYFGGNQAWMSQKKHAAGGCGVIAAANLTAYYRGQTELSRDSYMVVVESLYHWLSPVHLFNPFAPENTYGLPFFRRFARRLARYFESIGLHRQPEILSQPGYEAAREFIRRSLQAADPVIILIIGHRRLKRYNNHYMTITGFDDAAQTVFFSTWGVEESLPLRQLYHGATIFRLARFKQV